MHETAPVDRTRNNIPYINLSIATSQAKTEIKWMNKEEETSYKTVKNSNVHVEKNKYCIVVKLTVYIVPR